MWEKIDFKFFQAYMPPVDNERYQQIFDVCKIFSLKILANNTSYVKLEDGTINYSYDIYEVLLNMWTAIQQGKRIDEVYTPIECEFNWREQIPDIFKNLNASKQDSGQAKIFYSVVTAVSGVKAEEPLHVIVPGAGPMEYGWSYTAVAMLLTDRGCTGRFDLYDPLAEEVEKMVGNFKFTYHKRTAPRDYPDTVTHVVDDTFPSAISLRLLNKLVTKGVVVSTKASVRQADSRLNSEAVLHRLPGKMFMQPFYNGNERRMVYNYRPEYGMRKQHICNCYDCAKMAQHPLNEEEWHHAIGFGVRPCFSVKGKTLINQAYAYYTGRKTMIDIIKEPLETIPKLTKYLRTLETRVTEEVHSIVERTKKKTEYYALTNFSAGQSKPVSEIVLPCIVKPEVSSNIIRAAFHGKKIVKTAQCFYVTETSVEQLIEEHYTGEFKVNLSGIPEAKARIIVTSQHKPDTLLINGHKYGFVVETFYSTRKEAFDNYHGRHVYEATPCIGEKSWVLKLLSLKKEVNLDHFYRPKGGTLSNSSNF
jgi:hypothetical protein